MSSVLSSSMPPLPVGRSLDAALGLFRACLLTCLPYGVATVLASQLPQLYSHLGRVFSPGWWTVDIVSGLLAAAFLNATLLRLAAVARKAPVDARRELRAALARVPAFLGLILLTAATAAALIVPAWLLPSSVRPWAMGVSSLLTLALIALAGLAWVPLVLERAGVASSVALTVRRVRGNLIRVLAACAVGALMLLALAAMASVLMAVIVPLVGGDDLALTTAITANVMVACLAIAVPFAAALLHTLSAWLPGPGATPPRTGAAGAAPPGGPVPPPLAPAAAAPAPGAE